MNLYILVEGDTEKNVYPLWFKNLLPNLEQVNNPYDVVSNNYYIFSSGGFPSILDDIEPAVEEINDSGKFDYLMIVLDADELTIEERTIEVKEIFSENNLTIEMDKVLIVVQDKCFETWCLGNRKFAPSNIESEEYKRCVAHYDVTSANPELMPRDISIKKTTTTSQYHGYYLNKMFNERSPRLTYKKGNIDIVGQEYYLNQLLNRIQNTTDLLSFSYFINMLKKIGATEAII